jgi:hypothetical protein
MNIIKASMAQDMITCTWLIRSIIRLKRDVGWLDCPI